MKQVWEGELPSLPYILFSLQQKERVPLFFRGNAGAPGYWRKAQICKCSVFFCRRGENGIQFLMGIAEDIVTRHYRIFILGYYNRIKFFQIKYTVCLLYTSRCV